MVIKHVWCCHALPTLDWNTQVHCCYAMCLYVHRFRHPQTTERSWSFYYSCSPSLNAFANALLQCSALFWPQDNVKREPLKVIKLNITRTRRAPNTQCKLEHFTEKENPPTLCLYLHDAVEYSLDVMVDDAI